MGLNAYLSYVYVDAQYVRRELKNVGKNDEFNPANLWQLVAAVSTDGQPIRPVRMFFYDAIDDQAAPNVQAQLQQYLERVEKVPYVSVETGFIRPGKRRPREQKTTDVRIAVDALEAAWARRADAICLVAGDADFCPLAEAVRRAGPYMLVFGYEKAMSKELQHSADVVGFLPDPSQGHLKPF